MDRPLDHLVSQLTSPKICVCGDFMLDTYVRGCVGRVSPEGPIPVLHVDEKNHRPGGAGSAAAMLRALECGVNCVGARGADPSGEELKKQLESIGCEVGGLLVANDRPTTLKTRYMGYVHSAGRGVQQMLRVDEESTSPVSAPVSDRILEHLFGALPDTDLLLIQDMAKGLFTPALLRRIIGQCRRQNVPVVVDPAIKGDYTAYRNATCILPNRMEAERAVGSPLKNQDDYARAAADLVERLELGFAVITLDREGMFFATRDGESALMPTNPRSVIDVTGAGDMAAAMLALALGCKLPLRDAVRLANAAAGMEVSRQGASPIKRSRIAEELLSRAEPTRDKIKSEDEIEKIAAQIRNRGESIAFTNGVFDLLHLGHVELIRFAANQADRLVVGMNTDRSVRAYKGPGRPITPQQIRAQALAAMPNVDYVALFDQTSVHSLIEKVRPDVLIKGGDYKRKEDVVGWEVVEHNGGRVMQAPHVQGYSTTELIKKIREPDHEN